MPYIGSLLDTAAAASAFKRQEELKSQADTVWRFIMDRQIEAPDEFASLQTHRVQLAVARRQLAFVEQLSEVCYCCCWFYAAVLATATNRRARPQQQQQQQQQQKPPASQYLLISKHLLLYYRIAGAAQLMQCHVPG
jgi:hypothetical protein